MTHIETAAIQLQRFIAKVGRVLCTAVAATATACGGGGGGSDNTLPPTSPQAAAPTTVPASSAAPAPDPYRETALALYESARLHSALATSPVYDPADGQLLWGCVWTSGTVQVYLDGSLLAAGTKLPTGTHAISATFANCLTDGLVGTTRTGTTSGTYDRTGVNDWSAVLSLSSMRGTLLAYLSDLYDVTAEGTGQWTYRATGDAHTTAYAYATTYTPGIGSKLVNNLTTNLATFGGGAYSSSVDMASSSAQENFNGLTITVNGTSYTLDGNLQYRFDTGGINFSSGEVRITSGGVLVARLYPGQDGHLGVGILAPLVAF